MSLWRRLMVGVGALLLVAPLACAREQTVTLGFVGVLSGPVALNGQLSSRGAQLAVEEINAAGGMLANGVRYQVRLVMEDDQGQPVPGVNAVQKLIQQDRAFAILGPEFSNVVLPTLPITDQHRVVQLHSTNSSVADSVPRPFAFRSRVEDRYLARAVVDSIASDPKGAGQQVAISYLNNEYGRTGSELVKQGLQERGIPVVVAMSHNFGDRDLTSTATAVLSAGANVVVTWTGPVESVLLLRTLKQLGWQGTFIHGNPDAIYLQVGQQDVEGIVGPQGWAPTDPRERSQRFVNAYRARFNQMPDNHAAAYYDAVYLLKAAIEAVGLDAERVRDYIARLPEWEGVQGRFHPADLSGGSLITATVLVQVQGGELKILRHYD